MKSRTGTPWGTRLANRALILICALGVVACNSTPDPSPSPSPSNSLGSGSTGGTGSGGNGSAPGSVLTQHNDSFRTGQNLSETTLTPANVNPTSFGKIASLPVDGQVYAQPLVASGVMINGTSHNVLYVATENDTVYAYDSDTLSTTPLWKTSMLSNSYCPDSSNGPCTVWSPADTGAPNISPEVGITSTPVIDPSAGVIYVVNAIKDSSGLLYWMLHGLSLSTGKDIPGSPVTIEGSLPGEGYGTDPLSDEQIHFAAKYQLSRAGLVLNNGLVYVAMTSWNDQEPTHGWLFAYDEATLEPVSAFITTPNTGDGTIWQAGAAPAVDDNGSIYFATGNGDPNAVTATNRDMSDSVLKLNFGDQGFDLQDYFTPYNFAALAAGDVDVGSGGVMLIPDQLGANPDLMVAGGKQGTIYLLNRNDLGQFNSAANATSDPQIVQELTGVIPGGTNYGAGIYGIPAYYQNTIFWGAAGDSLRAIPLVNGQLETSGMTKSPIPIALRGATPSISANGNADGIVWYIDASAYTYTWDQTPCTTTAPTACYPPTDSNGPAVLYAFSTSNLATPLYASGPAPIANSTDIPNPPAGTPGGSYAGPASDSAGDAVKYTVPTIVNGHVFVGTQTEISVYGLRSTQTAMNTKSDPAANMDESFSRSVASLLGGLGLSNNPQANSASQAQAQQPEQAPVDLWNLFSPIRSCSYRPASGGYSASTY